MGDIIKVLFAEDVQLDYEYALLAIKAEGLAIESICVDKREDFVRELKSYQPDLVISDYEMPAFNGREALEIVKAHDPALPFIMLTGNTNEEIAVACMREGAWDYLLKDKIKRLPFAIREAMERKNAIIQKQKIEMELRASERYLSLISENSADLIFALDLDLNYTFMSRSVERITGIKPESFIGKKSFQNMPNESRKLVEKTFEHEMALEKSGTADPNRVRQIELAEIHPRGHLIYYETSLSFLRDDNGKPTGIIGISRDITERKKAEIQLAESEQRFRKLISEMDQGLAVYEIILDETGQAVDYRFLDANPAFEKLTGLKIDEIKGKTVLEVLPSTEKYWIETYGKVATTGKLATFENFSSELNRYYHVVAYQNEPNQFATIITDITAKRKTEVELRESERKYRMLAENSADVIFTADLDLNYTYISPAIERINGYTVEETLKRKVDEAFTAESKQKVQQILSEELLLEQSGTANPNRGRIIEIQEYHKKGHIIHVESAVSFIHDENGKPVGIMGVTRDITEHVKSSEALKWADLIIRNSSVLTFMWNANDHNKTEYVSSNTKQILGYDAALFINNEIDYGDLIHPEDFKRVKKEVEVAKANPEVKSFRHKPYRVFKADGEIIWMDDLTTILRNEMGNIIHFQGVLIDITEKIEAEQKIRESEERLDQIFTQNQAVVWETDANGLYSFVSQVAQKVYGYAPEELVGKLHYYDLYPEEFREQYRGLTSLLFETPKTVNDFRNPIRRKDGELIWVSTNGSPIFDDNNRFLGYRGSDNDITAEYLAKKELEGSYEMLEKLTAQVPGVVYQYRLWPDGRSAFPYSSPGMWEIYEFLPEELTEDASPVFTRLHPDDVDLITKTINESAEKQSIYHQEFRVILPEQGLRWRLSDARPEKMPDGSTLWYGIVSDITERKKTEEIIERSEAQLREVFENTPAGLISFDDKGIITECNAQFVSIIGSSREKLIGLDMTKLPDEHIKKAILGALNGQKTHYEGLYHSFTAQKSTEVSVEFAPIANAKGEITGGVGIIEDISERVTSEKALRKSEERFRMVYENSPIGILNFDHDGILLDCNQQFIDIIGSTKEKVFGLDLKKLKNQEVVQCVHKVLAKKTAMYEGEYVPITGMRTAELRMQFAPLLDAEDQLVGGVGIIEDITERKLAEEKLRQSDRFFNHAMDMLCIAGFDGYFKQLNPAWSNLLGYSTEEMLAKPWIEFVHPDDVEATENAKSTIVDGKEVYQFENRYVCKDGAVKWLSWNSFPYEKEGVMFGVVRDITQQKKNDQELKESERLFSTTFFNSPVALFINRLSDNLIVEVNDAFCRLTGYTRQHLLGTTPSDLNLTDKELHQQLYQEILQKDRISNAEFPIFTRTGEQQIVMLSVEKIDLQGEPHVLISMFDITERKLYETELARLTQAVEQSPVSIVITDLEGNIQYVNPTACQVTGYYAHELIGQNPRVLNSGEKPQEEYKAMYDALARGETWTGEFHNKKKNGELFWESASISPVFNDRGEMISYIAVKEDITASKKLQADLVESENRYRDMFESNPLPMWIYDVDTLAFVEVNAAAVEKYGYSQEEFLGMTLKDIRPDEDIPKLVRNIKQSPERFQKSDQWRHLTKDGKLLDVEINSHAVLSPEGRNLRLVLVNDVTERVEAANAMEKAKEMAEASNRLKTTFLNNISHEVRTPLNGILGVMSLLSDPDMDEEERESLNEIVSISSERLMQTITDYMDISLLTSGSMEYAKKTVPVLSMLERITRKTIRACEINKIDFVLDVPEKAEVHFVETDEELLSKTLLHLMSNAVKFTKTGTISAGYRLDENSIQFFVKDTGKGIKPEYLPRIFEPFSQEEEGNVRKFEGSGLGLSIIKGISELIGAELEIESELDKGTTIFVSLPLRETKTGDLKAKPVVLNKDEQPLILVAEDDDSNFFVLSMMLVKALNAKVIRAVNGEEAVEHFNANPDTALIMMDLKMPRMDGFEATKIIRKKDKEIPIIAITAYAMSGDERRALDAGCSDYLAKPVAMAVLLNKLAEFGLKRKEGK